MQPTSWKKERRDWVRERPRPHDRLAAWPSSRPHDHSSPFAWSWGKRYLRRLGVQGVGVFVLSVLTLWLYQARSPALQPVNAWVARSLQQDWNFAAVKTWYQKNIGTVPSFLPVFADWVDKKAETYPVVVSPSPAVAASAEVNQAAADAAGMVGGLPSPFARIYLPASREIRARHPGKVLSVMSIPQKGYRVMIQYDKGWAVCLDGLQEVGVAVQEGLRAGQVLGRSEREVTYSVWHQGKLVDPTGWFSFV